MIDYLRGDWHWAVSGFLAGITMLALTWFGKSFGLTSTYGTICSIALKKKWYKLFDPAWKEQIWNLVFAGGIILGGFITNEFLTAENTTVFGESTTTRMLENGLIEKAPVDNRFELLPPTVFDGQNVTNLAAILFLVIGGIVSGFGSRYAGGCTSGHFISGLSNLQIPSFITLCFFFVGGILSANFLLPLFIHLI